MVDDMEVVVVLSILSHQFDFLNCLHQYQATNHAMVALQDEIQARKWARAIVHVDSLVTFDTKLYIVPTLLLLHELMPSIHDDDHEGIQHTLHQLH